MSYYTNIMETIEQCDKEVQLCNSRIESGEDVFKMCKEQMRVLKNKREFFMKVKRLVLEGKYREAESFIHVTAHS